MKKSRSMRLASALLVCTLLSTCMISGTFAKYTTQDSGSDVARVAKWGVELQVVGNLYGDTYEKATYDDAGNLTAGNIITNEENDISVQSANKTDDVVAPGTKNEEGLTFKLTGKPEVDYQTTVVMKRQNIFLNPGKYGVMVKVANETLSTESFDEISGLYTLSGNTYTKVAAGTAYDSEQVYYTLEDVADLANEATPYYPVVYKLDDAGVNANVTEYTAGKVTSDSLKELADTIGDVITTNDPTAVAASTINNYVTTETYVSDIKNSNMNVAEQFKLSNERITWAWAFCSDNPVCSEKDRVVGDAAQKYCLADTILGNLMTNGDDISTQVVVAEGENYINLVRGNDSTSENDSEGNDYLVFKATDTNFENPVACLQTSFSIDITVTQVD